MLWTSLCDLLEIDVPIIQAGMGVTATSARLVAAVSNAGGLGSLGAFSTPQDYFLQELNSVRALTNRSFALNFVIPTLEEETFQAALDARPKVLAFALDSPGAYVQRCHDAGALVMHQVTTVQQAEDAAACGVDIIVAQGGEAGGYGGTVAALPLIPQVVDAVAPLPVVASGGIFDGRGVAAALMLGAVGVNLGTRFLASEEAPIQEWKDPITEAASEDVVKVDLINDLSPVPGTSGYGTTPRLIKTPAIEKLQNNRDAALVDPKAALAELGADRANRPGSGQSAGGIREILPAGEIIRKLATETEAALRAAHRFVQR